MADDRAFRAAEAKRILAEPLLVEAFARIEKSYVEGMISAPDDDSRRLAAEFVRALRDVRKALELTITEGQAAERRGPTIA